MLLTLGVFLFYLVNTGIGSSEDAETRQVPVDRVNIMTLTLSHSAL